MRCKTIVVLESNGALLVQLKEALGKSEGLSVVYAGDDGEAGIQQIRQLKPDLAMVGMFLKGTDGCGVIQAIRKEGADTRIIATGVPSDTLMEKAMREGGRLLFSKTVFPVGRAGANCGNAEGYAGDGGRSERICGCKTQTRHLGRKNQRYFYFHRDSSPYQGLRISAFGHQDDRRTALYH